MLVVINYCPAMIEEADFNAQWLHPSLSEAEIQKAENECVMKSYEAIGGGLGTGLNRQDYIDSCMEGHGFVRRGGQP